MAGTFTAKVLAEGQADSPGPTAIYTVPASTTAYVRLLRFFNTNATQQIVQVNINAGTSRQLYRLSIAENASDTIEEPLILEASDAILVGTTTASALNYIVCGVEET
jgi:hypothetical protein